MHGVCRLLHPSRTSSVACCIVADRLPALDRFLCANGQQFTQHQDFFSRDVKVHLARGGQRIATVLMYLHRAEVGGATYFPIQKLRLNPTEGGAQFTHRGN